MKWPIDEYGHNWEEKAACSAPTRSPCPSPSNLPRYPEIGVEHQWNRGRINRPERQEAEVNSQERGSSSGSSERVTHEQYLKREARNRAFLEHLDKMDFPVGLSQLRNMLKVARTSKDNKDTNNNNGKK